jgi:hypothetical protein
VAAALPGRVTPLDRLLPGIGRGNRIMGFKIPPPRPEPADIS